MIDCLPGVSSTVAALNAEKIRLEIIGQNIANAHTTRGPDGLPYQRLQVSFESVLDQQRMNAGLPGTQPQSVRVSRIVKDTRPPMMVHNPGHPDANNKGMVAMPNINVHEEMADMISASRAFEDNLAVIRNARTMAIQALAIGKR